MKEVIQEFELGVGAREYRFWYRVRNSSNLKFSRRQNPEQAQSPSNCSPGSLCNSHEDGILSKESKFDMEGLKRAI